VTTEYEAIKAGTAEAVLHWLETHPDRVEAGAKSAVLDWIELTRPGSCAISWGAEQAVTDWVKGNEAAFLRALAEAVVKAGKY
jgi:hypothetical protein